jgi:hypothetical protein
MILFKVLPRVRSGNRVDETGVLYRSGFLKLCLMEAISEL